VAWCNYAKIGRNLILGQTTPHPFKTYAGYGRQVWEGEQGKISGKTMQLFSPTLCASDGEREALEQDKSVQAVGGLPDRNADPFTI